MQDKKHSRSNYSHQIIMQFLFGFAILAVVFVYSANVDILMSQNMLATTAGYINVFGKMKVSQKVSKKLAPQMAKK